MDKITIDTYVSSYPLRIMSHKIAISGGSGFVGTALTHHFRQTGYEVIHLPRPLLHPDQADRLIERLEGCDTLIHLAGASISQRWTSSYKKKLMDSRVLTTRSLVHALHRMSTPPRLFISASAVGFYPTEGEHDEYSTQTGNDYLATICRAWEHEAQQCPPSIRLVIMRLGVVLSPRGGALNEMIRMQRLTLISAIIGTGKQPFAWISLEDACRAVSFFMTHPETRGVYNLVAPEQITQRDLARQLYRHYRSLLLLPLPGWIFRLRFGEGAALVLKGQNVRPTRLEEAGFCFLHPTMGVFFTHVPKVLD